MRVRAIDANGDWTFGKGQNDYLLNKKAVEQNIKTRLQEFIGDCFWNLGAGVDWFTYLGGKDEITLNLSISSVIGNTTYVVSFTLVSVNLNRRTRNITITYTANTAFGLIQNDTVIVTPQNFITTQDGDILITEGGEAIIA